MTTRYYEETQCEHGRWTQHILKPDPAGSDWCPGGSRRELEDVEVREAESLLQSGWFVNVPIKGRYAIIPLEPTDG